MDVWGCRQHCSEGMTRREREQLRHRGKTAMGVAALGKRVEEWSRALRITEGDMQGGEGSCIFFLAWL